MKLKVINSNSDGNCYLLKSSTSTLMLDCGCTLSQIKKGCDFKLSEITACLVSHSHL